MAIHMRPSVTWEVFYNNWEDDDDSYQPRSQFSFTTDMRYPTKQDFLDGICKGMNNHYTSSWKCTEFDPNVNYTSILIDFGNIRFYCTLKEAK